jgi:hypothetical protein
MAQANLNAVGSTWVIDPDMDGINPGVADKVFRNKDIEQFSFSGEGGHITIYNGAKNDKYMEAKALAREESSKEQAFEPTAMENIQGNSLQELSFVASNAQNPALRDLQFFADEKQAFIFSANNDKLMWINFNETASRDEIETAITDKLGITDREAVTELVDTLDRNESIHIPTPAKFDIDRHFEISATTKSHVTIVDKTDIDSEPIFVPKADTSPERIAERLGLDMKQDKKLIDTISKACNPPDVNNTKGYRSFENHLRTAALALERERKKHERQTRRETERAERAMERGERYYL